MNAVSLAELLDPAIDAAIQLREASKALTSSSPSAFYVARNVMGMNQTEFASTLDISQPYLSQIESGHRTPSLETLQKLRSITEGVANGNSNQAEEDKEGDEAEAS